MKGSNDSGLGAASGTATAGTDVLARETYRHLRLMLATLPALILLAILALAVRGTVEDSISAYYGQPVRDVFVGALVGIGVCLIVYRGFPPFEDFALNLAGFFAFFVAFVPNTLAEDLLKLSEADRREALFGLRASVAAVVVVAIIFVFLEWRFGHWSLPTLWQRPITRWVLIAAYVFVGVFLVLVVVNGFLDDDFADVHRNAAILLFASLAMAVAAHAWPGKFGSPGDPRHRKVFWLMVAGVPFALILEFVIKSDFTVIILEAYEILLFFWFWVVEARRTWNAPVPG